MNITVIITSSSINYDYNIHTIRYNYRIFWLPHSYNIYRYFVVNVRLPPLLQDKGSTI